MVTSLLRRLRSPLTAVLALTLVAGLLVVTPGTAGAVPTSRLAGADRYATAAAVSRSAFAAGVPVAFVVTGRDFPDALAAGPAAARRGGPVLLVEPGAIPRATADELTRLRPGEIVVVGGTSSVSAEVERQLDAYTAGSVRRVAGGDRFATAVAVSDAAYQSASTVFVANGFSFADALAGVPAAHRAGAPVLLVLRSGVPQSTADEIRALRANRIVILGGPAAVDAAAEAQLRSIAPTERYAGDDRHATSAAVSSRAFASAPVAYLATGASYADALAGGPVAAVAGGPILLVGANCVPIAVENELRRLKPGRIVLLGGPSVLGPGVEERSVCPYAGAPSRTASVSPSSTPAWNDDGPDPDLVRFGTTWYLYTTGTTWGNNLGVLTSTSPISGWRTTTGKSYGSTALANIPSWQEPGTQWAPGVYSWRGRYIMFYAGKLKGRQRWCISVASADVPQGPFTDRTSGPVVCQADGSIDPKPFVDAHGTPFLYWKNNDEFSTTVSKVWAARLGDDGMSLVSGHHEVLAKNSQAYPWQTTVDNPQMVLADGRYYLFHTGGDYQGNESYKVGFARCAGPLGPCSTHPQPILGSYGNVAGPGGGTVARDLDGNWWMSYHGWTAGCTSYSCGGKRKVYVSAMGFF